MPRESYRVVMGDGVKLATDVYRPDHGRAHPVLLMMTPYGRNNVSLLGEMFAQHGYAVVIQDVRGRYDSEGIYRPIQQEKCDGPQTVDWVARQPWYNEAAGMGVVGLSYLSAVGFICAARRPEHIRAFLNVGGFADIYDISHRGGAVVLHHLLPWSIITSHSPQPDLREVDWERAYSTRPLKMAAEVAGYDNRLWRTWMEHPTRDEYWSRLSLSGLLAEVDVPILHASGWYDMCLGETLKLYRHFRKHSGRPQHLVVGPWSHNGVVMGPTALQGVDFGEVSRPDMQSHIIGWFDRWLKGVKPRDGGITGDDRPVAVFVTGENEWALRESWPPEGTGAKNLYLTSRQTLACAPEKNSSRFTYSYDPADPVPTRGGAIWEFPTAGLNPGPADQTPALQRDDVLLFVGDDLDEPFTALGEVILTLFCQSDCETTDFAAKLVDIHPDGRVRIVTDGIVRGHLRDGDDRPRPLEPDETCQLRVDMWACGHTFAAGHRVGVEITSSNFPKWDANPNVLSGGVRTARQTVLVGGRTPSQVTLRTAEAS